MGSYKKDNIGSGSVIYPLNQTAYRVAFLDHVRGIAIISVFLFHALAAAFGYSMLPWNGMFRGFSAPASFLALLSLNIGWIGVPIFFVVSGFCIHMSFQREGQEWSSFYIRRFFRIYPAYLAALLLFASYYSNTGHDLWLQLRNHLLLIHNFDRHTYHGINSSFWTIAVEVQLYLAYPFLLMLVGKLGWRRTLMTLAIIESLIHGWDAIAESFVGAQALYGCKIPSIFFKVSPIDHFLNVSPFAYWFSWSLGAFTADAFLKGRPMSFARCSVPLWGCLVIASYLARPLAPFFFPFSAVLTATVISKCLSGFRPNIRVPQFFLDHLRKTGVCSYSIYLLHQPLLAPIAKLFSSLFWEVSVHPLLRFLICVASWGIIMPLGYLWYLSIEKPGIAFGKRAIQKMTAMRQAPSVPAKQGG
jgi:peptidoglycan/LPS O-acetylase OafA/YrhL